MTFLRTCVTHGCGLVLALLWLSLSSVAASANPGFGGEGAMACIDCHGNGHVMGILETAHAEVDDPDTPAAQQECQSCHGPSKIHMRFPMQVENLHFGKESKAKPDVQNQACLECHAKGARETWEVSAHGFEEVVCSRCHSIHDPAKVIPKTATLNGGCSVDGCHATLMGDADTARFSHAVGKKLGDDGQLTCASCHNPHGPLDSGRCIDCHAQTPEILAKESEKARRFHEVATRRGPGCIRCHQELSHPIKQLEELRRQGSVEGDSVQ